ncbi:hypothetical protein DPMN_154782 [Dreissena polymorpha]|uniref:Uncharacterized protein n=1 Tax=Dreissena polymorpha TaxID=45954 RepID=A0A9D4FNA2_DREPO|nr:hypothetical protein DPMN_154782 [Dreissena polymorpha]
MNCPREHDEKLAENQADGYRSAPKKVPDHIFRDVLVEATLYRFRPSKKHRRRLSIY